jgi:hypothetical protein
MYLKKPSFRRTDFSPSWTHKSDSLPNFGVNNIHHYLQRKTADAIARGEKPSYGGLYAPGGCYGPSSSNRKDG